MYKLIVFLMGLSLFQAKETYAQSNSIYDYQVRLSSDSVISLGSFRGQKILFVNTASNSLYSNQYAQLDTLYQLYKDSLVIIAFPSNDFSNEPDSNAVIQNNVYANYHIHYYLAGKISVTGANIDPLYGWLTQSSQNGLINNPVEGDFYKFLVDKAGNMMGVFATTVAPTSDAMQQAIQL